ncbi:MAG: phosphotransferase [Pseudomonadota bacterium]
MIKTKFKSVIDSISHAKRFDYSTVTYGWHKKSLGIKFQKEEGSHEWLRISDHLTEDAARTQATRILNSNSFAGIKKPKIYETSILKYNGIFWSIILMSYHKGKSMSSTPSLKDLNSEVSAHFLSDIKNQLDNLSTNDSLYVAYRQELITRRIQERYHSNIDTIVKDWVVVHGDLHWANISFDGFIFDWEGYGIGPRGIDIAFLYLFSLMNNYTKKLIENIFCDYFSLRQFKICLLFGVSELMRMTEIYNDHPELYSHLKEVGIKTHRDLECEL